MNDQMKEEFLQNVLSVFSEKVKDAAEEAIGKVYTEYLPFALEDTESNAHWKAQRIIEDVLEGKFTVKDDWISVDGQCIVHLSKYKTVASNIYNNAQKEVENAVISELQDKIDRLKIELEHAYSQSY